VCVCVCVTVCGVPCDGQMSTGSLVLLVAAVAVAALGRPSEASPFGEKLAAAQHAGAVATSAATTAELKKHAVTAHSDRGKRAVAPASPLMGLQMGNMFPGATESGASKLDDNDPAAAMTRMIAPEDVPQTDSNGTIIEDKGLIGADGKRQGKLAPPPDFTFPIVLASVTSVIMVVYFVYACCIQKEEPRKKGDSYM
jgi:hypothetical protein